MISNSPYYPTYFLVTQPGMKQTAQSLKASFVIQPCKKYIYSVPQDKRLTAKTN
jgi:hypothetical protein